MLSMDGGFLLLMRATHPTYLIYVIALISLIKYLIHSLLRLYFGHLNL